MNWSAKNHNVSATVNFNITPKWSLFGNFLWADGRGAMDGINLDSSKVPAIPPGFNYAAISELGKFSALAAARTQDVVGMNYDVTSNWVLNATYYFARFKDRSPYLLDATGRTQGIEAGISYVF
jgi:hypothetical protein